MLLVYGPRSTSYDFGPSHPLTPRRFGPAIDLLAAVGAEPGMAPEPVPDAQLEACHSPEFVRVVRGFSADPFGLPNAGIAEYGDVPPFRGMHAAGAMVAGGSLQAMEAILRGDVDHAFHPGGGLHHAMRDRASGFCIYNDVALAIARARRDGLRVLYLDFDVHHGDGVQDLFYADPGVLTFSIHETGRYLFPGTGFADEIGEGRAAGTSINVPLQPGTGEGAWLEAVRLLAPALAASFRPDVVVSQHGADSHAFDPLAHLRVTTTAMGEAARIVDAVAHRWAGGRWLATGGGGYDAYRVVPRSWSLVWLAGAHREVPSSTPVAWRERWADEAARHGQAPPPETFVDPPNAGVPFDAAQAAAEERSRETASAVGAALLPALIREAVTRDWWDPLTVPNPTYAAVPAGAPTVHARLDADVSIAAGVAAIPLTSLQTRPGDRLSVTAAVVQDVVVGAVVSAASTAGRGREILSVGVAPEHRGHGLATAMLETHVRSFRPADEPLSATLTVAERDWIDPLDPSARVSIARSLFERAGFAVRPSDGPVRSIDPLSFEASLG
ncbi:MAG TPA: GNAT family N-acetyltransferase [Candidatus Limnocylindrales bacterium]|nr:GNAT family N-acetyltransferase [Candidatus Limnocylindrales bacterium]